MSNATPTVLDLLSPGDTITVEEGPTIEFGGRTWRVHNFAGDRSTGAMIVSISSAPDSIGEIINRYMLAAVNVAVITADWSKVTPEAMGAVLAEMLADRFISVHDQHMQMLANRKPS